MVMFYKRPLKMPSFLPLFYFFFGMAPTFGQSNYFTLTPYGLVQIQNLYFSEHFTVEFLIGEGTVFCIVVKL